MLFGATASGKSALIEELAASGLRFELISADSMQVYRGMDIGTAKPDPLFRAKIPHHLIDVREPSEQYCAGDFVRDASLSAAEAQGRGALPLVSGGTAFYLKNLVMGLSEAPPSDPAIRQALQLELAERGPEALRAELERGDPESAKAIHPNDHYRLCRSLELLRGTGKPRSAFPLPVKARADIDYLALGIERGREELYARINARVEEMFAQGLQAEVASLVRSGYGPSSPGMAAIGYSEFLETLPVDAFSKAASTESAYYEAAARAIEVLSPEVLGAVKAKIQMDTRRFAKRQELFFRELPGAQWLGASETARFIDLAGDFAERESTRMNAD